MERHPVVAQFPDRLTHGGSVYDWRRLAGFWKVCVSACVCVCAFVDMWMLCNKGKYVCESVLDERFHVSSTVTVRTSAIHVSPSTSVREAPSTNTKETVNQTHLLSPLFII